MKGARNENNKQSKQGHVNRPRPDIRDNMDSREAKEDNYKGDANKPEKKEPHKKGK